MSGWHTRAQAFVGKAVLGFEQTSQLHSRLRLQSAATYRLRNGLRRGWVDYCIDIFTQEPSATNRATCLREIGLHEVC